jgi:hypothetical protein
MRDNMADPIELVSAVFRRTRERKLEWSPLSMGGFIARIGPNSLVIDRISGTTGYFTLRVTNDKNTVVESITNLEISDQDKLLESLYELARRQALRIDETLSNVKDALDKL